MILCNKWAMITSGSAAARNAATSGTSAGTPAVMPVSASCRLRVLQESTRNQKKLRVLSRGLRGIRMQ